MCRDLNKGGARGAIAPPHFGRIEGAAGQRRRAALLLGGQFEEAIKAPDVDFFPQILQLTRVKVDHLENQHFKVLVS